MPGCILCYGETDRLVDDYGLQRRYVCEQCVSDDGTEPSRTSRRCVERRCGELPRLGGVDTDGAVVLMKDRVFYVMFGERIREFVSMNQPAYMKVRVSIGERVAAVVDSMPPGISHALYMVLVYTLVCTTSEEASLLQRDSGCRLYELPRGSMWGGYVAQSVVLPRGGRSCICICVKVKGRMY
jgi:hypothetical protein